MQIKCASLLDFSYPGLPVDMWQADGTLFSYQKDFILKLLNSCYENYQLKSPEAWVTDVTIVGSTTTTKNTRTSDVDVHVLVNIDEFIKTNMPKMSKEEAMEKLDTTRREFDRAKILLPMSERPTEFFFESPELNPANEQLIGRYSILQNKWLKAPIAFAQDDDFEITRQKTIEGAKGLANELDASFSEIGRQIQRIDELNEVLKAWPKEKRQLYYDKIQSKLDIIEEEIEKSMQIKQELVDERHSHQDPLSDNEIKFKFLARYFYFKTISELKAIVGEEAEVTTEDLPLIEKIISEGALRPSEYSKSAVWIAPEGTIYEVINSHPAWVYDNYKLLEKKYGLIGDPDEDIGYFQGRMLDAGWTRVGDIGSKFGSGVEVADLKNIPTPVFDYLLKNPIPETPGWVIFESQSEGSVEISMSELPEGQKAVNRALSHKRLQTASLNKQAAFRDDHYWIEPSGQLDHVYSHMEFIHSEGLSEQQAIELGWIRIFVYNDSINILLNELNNFPQVLKDFIIEYSDKDTKEILVEDLKGNTKSLEVPHLPNKEASLKQAFLKEAFEDCNESSTDLLIDFDGTICKELKFPEIGEPMPGVKEALSTLKELGYSIIIYTCRIQHEGQEDAIKEYLDKHEIPYDSIFEGEKPFAFKYIDNRAISFDGDWDKVVKQVEKSDKIASLIIKKAKILKLQPYGGGVDFPVLVNPIRQEVLGLLRRAIDGLRVIKGNDLYVWNATKAIHEDVLLQLVNLGYEEYSMVETGIFYNAEEINKWYKTASLHIISDSRYFVDPNGKIFPVKDTHESWVIDNTALLRGQYKFWENHPEELYPEETDNVDRIIPVMLKDGWSRVGDLFGLGKERLYGKGIEIADLNNVPQSTFDFISQWHKDKYFMIEDLQHRYVELSVEELMADGQEAVSRALQRGKMVHAALSQKYWIDPSGKEYPIPVKLGHYGWIAKNLLNQSSKVTWESNPELEQKATEMIQEGWTRITTESDRGADFGIEVANLKRLPSYLDDFIAKHYTGNGLELDDLNGDYAVVADPFPNIQKRVNQYLNRPVMARAFSKKEAYEKVEAFLLGPYGEVLNVDRPDDHESAARKLTGNPLTTLLTEGWATLRTVADLAYFGVAALGNIPATVNNYLAEHKFNRVAVGPYGGDIGTLPEPPQVSYEDAIEHGIQNAINRSIIEMQKVSKEAQTKKVKQGEYGCLMSLVPHELAQEIVAWGVKNIPDDALYIDEDAFGRELEVHCTIKYGLISDDAKTARRIFNDHKPFKAKLGKIRHFEPDVEYGDFDVVTVEVESKDLEEMNKEVCEKLECAKGLPADDYKSHITIAYVQKGEGKKFIGSTEFEGREIELDTVVFSPAVGNKTYFSMGDSKKEAAYRGNMDAWLAPDGQEFSIHRSHTGWIVDETNLLNEDYDLVVPSERTPEGENLISWLVSKGWVRVTGMLPIELDLLIQDINNIPQAAEQFVWKYKPEMVIVEDLQGNDTSFDREEYSKGMMKKAEFLPSLFNAPDNRYQFEHGGDDKQLAVNEDPISDDTTLYGEWWQDKPRNPEAWRMFISMFSKPLSKKDEMTVESSEEELVNIGTITLDHKKFNIEVSNDLLEKYFNIVTYMEQLSETDKNFRKLDIERADLHNALTQYAFNKLFPNKDYKDFPIILGTIKEEISTFLEEMIPMGNVVEGSSKKVSYDKELEQKEKDEMTVEAGEAEEWDSHYGDIWHVGDKVKDKVTGKIGIIKSINGTEVELEEVE